MAKSTKSTKSSSAARRAPTRPAPYPVWAVAAVVVVGLGLIAAAVRVATLDRGAPAPQPTLDPAPAPESPLPPPRPARPAAAPAASPAPQPAPDPQPDPEPAPPPPPAPAHATTWPRGATETATVERVTSGDAVELSGGRRVRLIGIDAPGKDEPLQAEARALLARLVEGKQVTLELDQERSDQYGRTLGYLHAGDLFVNGELVRQGLAICSAWEPNLAHLDELVGWQKEARQARAGLWSLPPPSPAERYLGVRGQRRFHRPECKFVQKLEGGKRLEYPTREAALDQGDSPCAQCRP